MNVPHYNGPSLISGRICLGPSIKEFNGVNSAQKLLSNMVLSVKRGILYARILFLHYSDIMWDALLLSLINKIVGDCISQSVERRCQGTRARK